MAFDFAAFLKWCTGTVLAGISFAGWVIALINTILIHEDCGSNTDCDNFMRRYWWSLMFQASIMSVAFLIWVTGGVPKTRAALVGFLALVTVQHIELIGKLLTALDDASDVPENAAKVSPNKWLDDEMVRGSISGFTLLAFANMVYMLIFGMTDIEMPGRGTTPTEGERKEEAPTAAETTSPV